MCLLIRVDFADCKNLPKHTKSCAPIIYRTNLGCNFRSPQRERYHCNIFRVASPRLETVVYENRSDFTMEKSRKGEMTGGILLVANATIFCDRNHNALNKSALIYRTE